jgi:FkbM family methyltransferase
MGLQHQIRKVLWKFGYDVCAFTPATHFLANRKHLLESYKIDTVLDIGANAGQYALELRRDIRFTHRILSFEPLSTAFQLLRAQAEHDPAWEVFNYALGATEEKREIHVAANSFSSSLLHMLPAHMKSAPRSKYIGKEVIEVKTLDSLFPDLCKGAKRIYMKIDTQGFERKVLEGAEQALPYIDTVQMEMSLIPLYAGELLFNEMCLLMGTKGYTLIALESAFSDPDSGQLLQVDGVFHRFPAPLAPEVGAIASS